MNTKLNLWAGFTTKQVKLSLHSLWIGMAALGCAFLLEAGEVNLTYPLQVFLKGVMADNTIIEDHLYTIKL